MKKDMCIVEGQKGYCLEVQGFFVRAHFNGIVEVIPVASDGRIPVLATEWVTVEALQKYWAVNQANILTAVHVATNMDKLCQF